MRRTALAFVLTVLPISALAQSPAPGLRVYGGLGATTTQLVDTTGAVVHTWSSPFTSFGAIQLLADGTLLRDIVVPNSIALAGRTGGLQRLALDGTVLWDYRHSGPEFTSHHDIKPLPNGNVLLIVWERKTAAEAVAAGRNPALLSGPSFYPDAIVEVQPTGPTSGKVVWEWHMWDHIIQDFDPTAANYGVVANHPELLDINYPPVVLTNGDWTHANGIDYDPIHDWIVLSCRQRSEILIIDHSTTTAEAASHSGGRWGKGGDLLYRWGNPAAYGAGTAMDQQLGFQHCPRFIPPGYPGEGNVTIFNNVYAPNSSAVFEIKLPLDASGNFVLGANGRYGPDAPAWIFTRPLFYSAVISSAQRLENGNTLICSGSQAALLEVTPDKEIAWAYSGPCCGVIFQTSYVDRTLWTNSTEISAASGGIAGWDLIAGSAHAGEMYLVLGSLSGTSPGIAIGGVNLPLNFDPFLELTGICPNTVPFTGTLGLLGANGRAVASFNAPPGLIPLELINQRMDFACIMIDLATATLTAASNPVPLVIKP